VTRSRGALSDLADAEGGRMNAKKIGKGGKLFVDGKEMKFKAIDWCDPLPTMTTPQQEVIEKHAQAVVGKMLAQMSVELEVTYTQEGAAYVSSMFDAYGVTTQGVNIGTLAHPVYVSGKPTVEAVLDYLAFAASPDDVQAIFTGETQRRGLNRGR
jgi:hypothetical protein